jgi:hypothetical protein
VLSSAVWLHVRGHRAGTLASAAGRACAVATGQLRVGLGCAALLPRVGLAPLLRVQQLGSPRLCPAAPPTRGHCALWCPLPRLPTRLWGGLDRAGAIAF